MMLPANADKEVTPARRVRQHAFRDRRRFSDLSDVPTALRQLADAPACCDPAIYTPLIHDYRRTRSRSDRDRLIAHFLPLVTVNARRLRASYSLYRDGDFDDMIGDGIAGLMRGLATANPETGSVVEYLKTWICTLIYRGQCRRLGITPRQRHQSRRMGEARERIAQAEGRIPGRDELVALLGSNGMRAAVIPLSQLDAPGRSAFIDRCEGRADQAGERLLERETIRLVMRCATSAADRRILRAFIGGKSMSDIARAMGISRQRILQRLNGVLWNARASADVARHFGCEPTPRPALPVNKLPTPGRMPAALAAV